MKMKIPSGSTAPDFTFKTAWDDSMSLYELLKKRGVILFFLRYKGCPLCQMKIAELKNEWKKATDKGYTGLVILQSSAEAIQADCAKDDFPFTVVCDPQGKIFELYGVTEATVFGYIALPVILRALKAAIKGYRHGKKEGREMQLPAVFLVDKNKTVRYSYYGTNISDVPPLDQVLS